MDTSGYTGLASTPNFRLTSPGVTLPLRTASTGVMRERFSVRNAHSALREGWYFTANTAVSAPSTARNTPVGSFMSRGRATLRFFIKYALPMSTVSPWMFASTPPSSQ